MLNIQSTIISTNITVARSTAQYNPSQECGDFDALLASFDTRATSRAEYCNSAADILNADNVNGFIDQLLNHIGRSLRGEESEQTISKYPFSGLFEATFGLRGPLPEYINMITARLGLSATQNQALQDIAVGNKDATRSKESVDKIAEELRAAGIYAG